MNDCDPPNHTPPDNPNGDPREVPTEVAALDPAAAREVLTQRPTPPSIADHELLRCIGRGSYG